MSETKYQVHFDLAGEICCTTIPPHRAIGDAQIGFWVNENFKWTVGQDSRYWIPPGRVLWVEAIR